MIKKIFNQAELIKLAIFLTVFGFVLLAFNLPFIARVNDFYAALKDGEQKLAAQSKAGSSLDKAQEDYSAFNALIPEAEDLFTASGQELKLITDLEQLAATHNLTQKLNLSPDRVNYSDQLEALTLSLELKGGFNDLLAYLADLSQRRFSLNVNAISLTQLDQNSLEIKLLTNTYWLKP
ncbi:MAG: type 4a pilus biogenesis protein PilO [Candidatus Komeilibacteria bacterium]|nr:type 4a pilus biogenesis protein PilO [Candidatus Komeilibacteria bacterium]